MTTDTEKFVFGQTGNFNILPQKMMIRATCALLKESAGRSEYQPGLERMSQQINSILSLRIVPQARQTELINLAGAGEFKEQEQNTIPT